MCWAHRGLWEPQRTEESQFPDFMWEHWFPLRAAAAIPVVPPPQAAPHVSSPLLTTPLLVECSFYDVVFSVKGLTPRSGSSVEILLGRDECS